jgi:hypothetical protein
MDALTSYAAEFPLGSIWSCDLTNGTTPPRPGKLTRRATPTACLPSIPPRSSLWSLSAHKQNPQRIGNAPNPRRKADMSQQCMKVS